MLDLNIDFGFSVGSASCNDEIDQKAVDAADADSVTSTTTCTTSNASASDELDPNSSTPRNSISTFNFSVLYEKAIGIEDAVNHNDRNELQLFPVDALSSDPMADRAKHGMNLSAPEVSCWGGVELGVFKGQLRGNNQVQQQSAKKSRRGPRSRSSQYRGITFYRRTGRWESHIWDCGKQVYLGGFDTAHAAARAYDRAAVKFRGLDADINFNVSDYEEDMKQTNNLTKEEFIQILRRQSNGLCRGSSRCRGMTMHKYGWWEARTGQFLGEKVYDKASIIYNQATSLANFDPRNYKREINSTATDGGSDRNLDLNLGITLASDGLQRKYTTKTLHFPYASNESPDGKTVQVQPSAFLHGLIRTPTYAPVVGGLYSGFAPNSKEETSMAISAEAIPLPGFSNLPWKMQGHSVVNNVPLLSSAASSGFFSNTTPYSNSLISSTSKSQFPAFAFNNLH